MRRLIDNHSIRAGRCNGRRDELLKSENTTQSNSTLILTKGKDTVRSSPLFTHQRHSRLCVTSHLVKACYIRRAHPPIIIQSRLFLSYCKLASLLKQNKILVVKSIKRTNDEKEGRKLSVKVREKNHNVFSDVNRRHVVCANVKLAREVDGQRRDFLKQPDARRARGAREKCAL